MQGVLTPSPRGARVRLIAALLFALALVPVAFIATHVVVASRNIVYWDEFDTALNFLIKLDEGIGFRDFWAQVFALSNEHRMVTSRLMFAVSYWLTNTIDFSVIGAIGNASLVALCVVLVLAAGSTERRVRLAVVLGMLVFQLEQFENFFWSGSSIDHFQVVLLAGCALVGLARGTRPAFVAATLCAVLATFTLAHGLLVWPVGAAMLGQARRWRPLAIWSGAAAVGVAFFFSGFHLNDAEHFAPLSWAGAWTVAHYWLALLGAVPALGHTGAAPWLGAVLLGALGGLGVLGAVRRERIAFPLACYAAAALALIALGRAAESAGTVHSRYYVLGALAWALVVFMALESVSSPRRPYLVLAGCLPFLGAFNVAANRAFAAKADGWLECRDRAALQFKQHGVDGRGPFSLYPNPARSTELLSEAERRGLYHMDTLCEEQRFPAAQPSARIRYFVDEMAVSEHAAVISGWAAIPGLASKRGQLHVVLRSAHQTRVFAAVTVRRPDVVHALKQTDWELSGFRFVRQRNLLPTGEYQIGLLFTDGDRSEFIMTAHRLRLVGAGEALLASTE